MAKNSKIYANEELEQIRRLITVKNISEKVRISGLKKKLNVLISELSTYVSENGETIEQLKRKNLLIVIKRMINLRDKLSESRDQNLGLFSSLVNQYNVYSSDGSLYLFRHCAKQKRQTRSGREYSGIKEGAVKAEARKVALELLREAHMSSKPVRLVLAHSPQDRTRIFAQIIADTFKRNWKGNSSKLKVEYAGKNPNLSDEDWDNVYTDEIDALCDEITKDKVIYDMYFAPKSIPNNAENTNAVVRSVENITKFVNTNYPSLSSSGSYTMVVGISHSAVLDWYLFSKIPFLQKEFREIINVAEGIKIEHGELLFRGSWTVL